MIFFAKIQKSSNVNIVNNCILNIVSSSSIPLSRPNVKEFRDSAELQHIAAQQRAALQVRNQTKPKVQLDRFSLIQIFFLLLFFFSMLMHILQASSSLRTPRSGTSSSPSFPVWSRSRDLWLPGLPSCSTSETTWTCYCSLCF